MEKGTHITELEVDRWGDVNTAPENEERSSEPAIEIFSLSAGVMKSRAQTANRIDGLLVRMLESPSSCKYVKDIDKNLDYLFTHLQLDMIARTAKDTTPREETRVEEEQPEPVISLDRVRISV